MMVALPTEEARGGIIIIIIIAYRSNGVSFRC